jgi:outer membrane immunogenic protein
MRFAVPGLAALALAAALQPSQAADLPYKMPVKAPMAEPVYNWYGFYIGGHIGYGWGSDPVNFTGATGGYVPLIASGSIPGSIANNASGLVGGLQWGENYQFGAWILGIDSDFSWTDIKASQTFTSPAPMTTTGSQKLEWLSTTRGRVGYLIQPNLMIFGSGGVADGKTQVTVSNFSGLPCTVPTACAGVSANKTRWGWAAGAGIEYATGPWLWRLEYLHYDLGSQTFTYSDTVTAANTLTTSTRFAGDLVRGALSYKFDWTPLDLLTGSKHF